MKRSYKRNAKRYLKDGNSAITVTSKAQGVPVQIRWLMQCFVRQFGFGNIFFLSFFLSFSLFAKKNVQAKIFFFFVCDYCFRISYSILFLIFCMIFVLISFVNFKFDFDLPLIQMLFSLLFYFGFRFDQFLLILGYYFDLFCKIF